MEAHDFVGTVTFVRPRQLIIIRRYPRMPISTVCVHRFRAGSVTDTVLSINYFRQKNPNRGEPAQL